MLPQISQLLILQDKDQIISRFRKELKRLPLEEERAKFRLSEDSAAVAKAKQAAQENDLAMKALELQIKTRQETIIRLKHQQGETRKNDELRALINEEERYKQDVLKLEDSELELMEKAEELKATLKEAQVNLAATQKRVEEEMTQLRARHANVDGQLKVAEAERAALIVNYDVDLVDQFDRIYKHRGDAAVVPLEGQICRGCNMKVSPSTVNGAKAVKNITTCSNCGRIVYWT